MAVVLVSRYPASTIRELGTLGMILSSQDHIKDCPREEVPIRYVKSWPTNASYAQGKNDPEQQSSTFAGEIYLLGDFVYEVDGFPPSKYPSTKTYRLYANERDRVLKIQFLDKARLTLRMEASLVFSQFEYPREPHDAPKEFLYHGEAESEELRKKPQETRRHSASPRRRSASPK
ncbi:hypothetical protein FLONG3_3092 [Fusarium longipes]|uniref:Uncharacterized protein n=1 Tax=Fusarium longipes TaxID=694270 RepID=A0A395T2C8_9HYPO|nr:hypothetical protein FLONG3_3092 [Fusarium longipes]